MPIAAAAPLEPPAPNPNATAATVASMSDPLPAASPTAPAAVTLLAVIAAFARLRMLLSAIAPPPLTARPGLRRRGGDRDAGRDGHRVDRRVLVRGQADRCRSRAR